MSIAPSKEPVRVSDHCVLRYLERAMGLNVELVREHILSICVAGATSQERSQRKIEAGARS